MDATAAVGRGSVNSLLTAIIVLCTSVALLLAAGVYSTYQIRSARSDLLDQVSRHGMSLAEYSRGALSGGSIRDLEQYLGRLQSLGVDAARVYAADGTTLAGIGRTAALPRRDSANPTPGALIDERRALVILPVIDRGRRIGWVYVESAVNPLYRRLARDWLVAGLVMLGSFALAMLASLGLRRRILNPISALVVHARRASGTTTNPAEFPPVGKDAQALGQVHSAMDALTDAVRERETLIDALRLRGAALMQCTPSPVYLLGDDGCIVGANASAHRHAPTLQGRLEGTPLSRIYSGLPDAVSTGQWPTTLVVAPASPGVTPGDAGGHARTIQLRIERLEQGGADEAVCIAAVDDRADFERVAVELDDARRAERAANQAKTRFLASINHEIRTPMTAIVAMTDLLGRTPLDDLQARYLEIVGASTNSLLGVIDDILELAWTDTGRFASDSLEFDICELVDDTIDMFADRCASKSLDLWGSVCPGVPRRLRGDPRHLRQVLMNLLGNAVKFTDSGEVEVRVSLAEQPQGGGRILVRFDVRDTGIGIPSALGDELFEPFARSGAPAGEGKPGAGIGLAVSHALVRALGGTIGTLGSREGGAHVWFTAALETARDASGAPDLAGVELLVMDESESGVRCICTQLQYHGASVRPVAFELHQAARVAAEQIEAGRLSAVVLGLGVRRDARRDRAAAAIVGRVCGLARKSDIPVLLLHPLGVSPESFDAPALAVPVLRPTRQASIAFAYLELVNQSATAPCGRVSRTAQPGARRGRILVADNDAQTRAALELVLDSLGYLATTSATVDGALELLDAEAFDLLLTDVGSTALDGQAVCRAVRSRERLATLPMIGMTASSAQSCRQLCLDSGMNAVLGKPVSVALLESVLQTWIGRDAAGA